MSVQLTHSKALYQGSSLPPSLSSKLQIFQCEERPPSSTECFARLSHAVLRSADFAATIPSRLRLQPVPWDWQSKEDTIRGGFSRWFCLEFFLEVFFLTFWISIWLVGWKTEEGQVGRRGSRSGVGEAIIRANLWSYLARPPRPTIAQSSEMLSWSSRYRSSYRSNAYCSSSYSISVMVIIPLISPIQGLCSLIVLGDQRCHPDPSTIKPHIIPPHNASQKSTFDSIPRLYFIFSLKLGLQQLSRPTSGRFLLWDLVSDPTTRYELDSFLIKNYQKKS